VRLEHLREFVLLAKYLNFSVAASKLYITQSVLSRHISSLEETLGVQLFNRTSQTVSLTDAGVYFLGGVTKLISDFDNLIGETCLRDQQYDMRLRIGVNHYAFSYHTGAVPQHFQTHYPRTKVSYRTGNPDQLIDSLLSDEVDAIIVNHFPSNPFSNAHRMEFKELFMEPYCILLPDNHQLCGSESVSIKDIGEESFVGVNTNVFSSSWKYLQTLFEREGFQPKKPILFDQLEEATVAIRNGAGIFIEGQILWHLTNKYLVCIPLDGLGCCRTVSVAYKKGNMNPAIVQLLDSYEHQLKNGWHPSI